MLKAKDTAQWLGTCLASTRDPKSDPQHSQHFLAKFMINLLTCKIFIKNMVKTLYVLLNKTTKQNSAGLCQFTQLSTLALCENKDRMESCLFKQSGMVFLRVWDMAVSSSFLLNYLIWKTKTNPHIIHLLKKSFPLLKILTYCKTKTKNNFLKLFCQVLSFCKNFIEASVNIPKIMNFSLGF